MKTVTFYSYKGGVGRTLALANIATRLSEFGKKVCVMDFDLEAPGLHFKFRNVDLSKKSGVVDYIYEYSLTKERPENIKNLIHTLATSNKRDNPISLISAGDINNSSYWSRLSKINWVDLLYEKDGILFLLDLKERIENELNPDFLFIDSRTGITEIAGITINLLADEVIILAANNAENLFGSKQLLHSIKDKSKNILNKEIKSTFVLTRIPHNAKPNVLRQVSKSLFNDYDKVKDILVIHSDDDLLLNESLKISSVLYKNELKNESDSFLITKDYLKLFEVITKGHLTPEDISKFKKLKEAENLLTEADEAETLEKKLSLIESAITLNPTYLEAFIRKAELLIDDLKFVYEKDYLIRECFDKIFEMEPDNVKAIIIKLHLYLVMPQKFSITKDKEEVLALSDKLIALKPIAGYQMKSEILAFLEDYDNAIELIEFALKIKPDDPSFLNTLANMLKKRDITMAFDKIYEAIALEPKEGYYYFTLAELYAQNKNKNEFYKNFELGLILDSYDELYSLQDLVFSIVIEIDSYKTFFKEDRFLNLLRKYKIDLKFINKLIKDLEQPERLILDT